MHGKFFYPVVFGLIGSVFFLLTTGCDQKKAGPQGGFSVGVVVQTVKPEEIAEKIFLIGTLAADESVEIKNEITVSI